MIRKLSSADQAAILDFAYQHESENLFVIGSFDLKDPFAINHYYGFFREGELAGLAMFSARWGSLTVNAPEVELRALVDQVVAEGHKIEFVPCFKRYADLVLDQLEKAHGLHPKKADQETFYTLIPEDFKDFSTGEEEQPGEGDRRELVILDKIVSNEEIQEPEERELRRILPERFFVLREEEKIVAQACIHGKSRNYFQIGGVGTLPEYRGRGLAKQVVSALIKHYFAQGIGTAQLFTSNDNTAAQNVYAALGFKPVDAFVIASF